MAKGFSSEKQGEGQSQKTVGQRTERINYQGKTPGDYANHAARKSVEQRLTDVNPLAQRDAAEHIQDRALLASRYIHQMLQDGTYSNILLAHLDEAEQARTEARHQMYDAIAGGFSVQEVGKDSFSNILSSAPSPLALEGR